MGGRLNNFCQSSGWDWARTTMTPNPSVTMLRMFARYATDNTNIVPIAQLEADMAKETL